LDKSTRVDEQVALQAGNWPIWLIRLPGGFSIASTFLLCRRELSFGSIWTWTFLIFGFFRTSSG
jgi:hypothetical protein